MEEKTDFLWCSYLATWGQSENGRQMVPHFMNEVGVGKKQSRVGKGWASVCVHVGKNLTAVAVCSSND